MNSVISCTYNFKPALAHPVHSSLLPDWSLSPIAYGFLGVDQKSPQVTD